MDELLKQQMRLKHNGVVVCVRTGPTAFAEINHYAFVYGCDGPGAIEYHDGKRWKPLYSTGEARTSGDSHD